ncbi:Aste57867_14872 [Aphanomyces stellatus]|uniref:Aste57867_14872 protein n=1 Tax=Aphanomyces stellatus TaxID=120398 RepID=A0A485L2M9_9STRA|nr:hypothetical protein As57867_014816 [Aphanomyces stellatus]VFT91689.1 Aste57867_14872 [Aphanomyces stellatus]
MCVLMEKDLFHTSASSSACPFPLFPPPPDDDMSEAEDIFGGLACAAFCGICCAVAAEEDKREREQSMIVKEGKQGELGSKAGPIQVNPVPVSFGGAKEVDVPKTASRRRTTPPKSPSL